LYFQNEVPLNILTLERAGNVGIGTTTPEGLLTVATSTGRALLYVNKSTGNVGIGTAAPRSQLEVMGTFLVYGNSSSKSIEALANGTMKLYAAGTEIVAITTSGTEFGGTTHKFVSGNVGIGTSGPDAKLEVVNTFMVSSAAEANGNLFTVLSTGNVGIGTTGPSSKLTVFGSSVKMAIGDGTATTTIGITTSTFAGTIDVIATTTAASMNIGAGNLYVSENGKIGIGTTTPNDVLEIQGNLRVTSGTPRIRLEDSTDDNKAWELQVVGSSDYLTIRSSNDAFDSLNDRLTILHSTGNVGIGTTTPEYLLHVDGDFAVGTTTMYVDAGGNVGIGTASPGSLLNISGSQTDTTGQSILRLTRPIKPASNFPSNVDFLLRTGSVVNSSALDIALSKTDGTVYQTIMTLESANGNVGIGTTTPDTLLSVQTSAAGGILLHSTGVGTQPFLKIRNADAGSLMTFGLGATTDDRAFLNITGGSEDRFDIMFSGDPKLTVKSTGNVGIGTTTPRYTLDVWGDMAVGTSTGTGAPQNYPLLYVQSGTGGTSNGVGIGTTTVSGTMLTVGTTTPALVVSQKGYVGIGTASPAGKLDITAPDTTIAPALSLRNYAGGNTYGFDFDLETLIVGRLDLYSIDAGARTNRMSWMRNGNVGIGTTGPSSKLTVFGSSVKMAIGDGTATTT
ncbi:hypothetical protein KKC44_06290, partial [Patescibacteria group bacterium]|nr:hypothetical protein [Patescibacteria group bacterium]